LAKGQSMFDPLFDVLTDLGGDGFAINNFCGHGQAFTRLEKM
jgi:hypothetical protein